MSDQVHYVYFSTLDSHVVLYTSHLDIHYINRFVWTWNNSKKIVDPML
jgi:hypothetical protein